MNLGIVSAITRKDVIDSIRHRYLLTALVTPLFVALLFRVLLPGVNSRSILTIVVHDPGRSASITKLRNTPQVTVVNATSADTIANEVERQNAIGGIVIPANFDANVAADKQPELTAYVNNKRTTFEQVAFRRLLDQLIESLVKQPKPAILVTVDLHKEVRAQPRGGGGLDEMLLPLLLILTFGMTGAFVVPLLLVEEKEKRTIDFLLVSPASMKEIIAGKAVTGAVYTLLIASLLLVINRRLINSWSLTLLSTVLGLLFVVGVGLLLGSFLNNTMQVNTWASFVLIILLCPSFPSFGLPSYVDAAMHLAPTYYLTEALKLSMQGTISARLWMHLGVLLACTTVTFIAAVWALRRRSFS